MQAVCLRMAGLRVFFSFGQFRGVCVFRLHIKSCSWNMSVFCSKQFYRLVSRTRHAILGHQVPRPHRTSLKKTKKNSLFQTLSHYPVDVPQSPRAAEHFGPDQVAEKHILMQY